MPLHKKYVTDSVKIKLPSVDIFVYEYALSFVKHTHTHRLTAFVRDYPGEPVPER